MMNYFIEIFVLYMQTKVSSKYEANFKPGFLPTKLNLDEISKNTVFESYCLTEEEEEFLREQELHNLVLEASSEDPNSKSDIVSGMNLNNSNATLITLAFIEYNKRQVEINKIIKEWLSQSYENQAKSFVDLMFAQFTARQISKLLFISMRTIKTNFLFQKDDSETWRELSKFYERVQVQSKSNVVYTEEIVDQIYKGSIGGSIRLTFKECEDIYKEFIMKATLDDTKNMLNLFETESFEPFLKKFTPKILTEEVIFCQKIITNFASMINIKEEHKVDINYEVVDYHSDENNFNEMTQVKIRCLNNNVEGIIYPDYNDIDTVIIHIHGGGFIAMSSITHLIHTREIAYKTSIPLFSIDYRLAPKYPYPNGFEDCVNAYVWLTTYGLKKMNLNPSKIILIGDSAGGNLISAISVLAIKCGIRVPDMLILLYPALQFSIESVFPSMFYFLTDPALNLSFARFINDSYIQDHKSAKTDYFLSPLKTPDDILAKFPKTKILVGTKDPLRDECYVFLNRLSQLNVDAFLTELVHFPHGFMNFNLKHAGMNLAEYGMNRIVEWIQQLKNTEKYHKASLKAKI